MSDERKAKNIIFNEGEFFYASSGSYSDYQVNGLFKVIQGFNAESVLLEFNSKNPELNDTCEEGQAAFLAYMVKLGFVEEIIHRELHLGDYEVDLSILEKD